MDPASLAVAAVGWLAAYLARLGGKVTDEIGGTLDDALAARLRPLHESIRRRVAGEDYAGGALRRFEAGPDDQRRRAALEDALIAVLDADRMFADELRTLVDGLGQEG